MVYIFFFYFGVLYNFGRFSCSLGVSEVFGIIFFDIQFGGIVRMFFFVIGIDQVDDLNFFVKIRFIWG